MTVASPIKPLTIVSFVLLLAASNASAQQTPASNEHPVYKQLKAFALTGGAVDVKGLALKRDRVQLTLDGVVYFSEPVNGLITGAVFIGKGNITVETPPNEFEKDNLKRLLGTDTIASDFKRPCSDSPTTLRSKLDSPRVKWAS